MNILRPTSDCRNMEDNQGTMDDIDQEFFSVSPKLVNELARTHIGVQPCSTPGPSLSVSSDPPSSSPQASNPSTPKRRHRSTNTHGPAIPVYLRLGSPVSRQASPTRHAPVASTPEKRLLFGNVEGSVHASNTDHQDDHFNGKVGRP